MPKIDERGFMQLPGLITLRPDQEDLIKEAADMVGESFMEEPWFQTWVEILDELGVSEDRKREIVQASFWGDFIEHSKYQGVYITEDLAACAGAYLFSDLKGHDHQKLEDRGDLEALEHLLTPEETRLLDRRADDMDAISNFSWALDAAGGKDHIYVYGWAVDTNKRGSGALRRMVEPFFQYADEHQLNMYLDCFSDNLQSLYEHLGFELIDVLSDPNFEITERRMVRKPNVKRLKEYEDQPANLAKTK
ncbi:MAG: GNAT family N-acetyltransferase [Eggerthellaceae bacterium]